MSSKFLSKAKMLSIFLCASLLLVSCSKDSSDVGKEVESDGDNKITSQTEDKQKSEGEVKKDKESLDEKEKSAIDVSKVSLFQSLEIPLYENSEIIEPENHTIPIIADKFSKIVVYLDANEGFVPGDVEVKFEINNNGETSKYESNFNLTGSSTIGDPTTAVQINVPKEAITTDSRYKISLYQKDSDKPIISIPTTGDAKLGAIETGPIKVQMIPYKIDGKTPDVSQEVLDGYRDAILAVYPTNEVIITLGEEREFYTTDTGDVLVDVGVAQEESNTTDIYFYGMIPAEGLRKNFNGSTGTSEDGGRGRIPDRAYFACGAAFGDSRSEWTLLHELGHLHKLDHSPAGDPPDVDPNYPDFIGRIMTMGYDYRTDEFLSPDTYDMMGYEMPRWISEYNYLKLIEHIKLSLTF